MNSMEGKPAPTTGPTSGVEKEVAKPLAAIVTDVILGCRDVKS